MRPNQPPRLCSINSAANSTNRYRIENANSRRAARSDGVRHNCHASSTISAPLNVGAFFQKINCFCFTEQRLAAGEKREMAVVFYVDPAMARDSDGANVDTITLSYTFYPQREPQRPLADGGRAGQPRI